MEEKVILIDFEASQIFFLQDLVFGVFSGVSFVINSKF